MSDELLADEIRRRERARRRKGPIWTVCSFLLHLALFAVIILLTPAKSLIFEPKESRKDAAKDLSSDRIEEIASDLSDVRINELLEQILALQGVLHNMDMMKHELAKSYDSFAEKNAPNLKDELKGYVAELERNQVEATNAQRMVRGDLVTIVECEKKDYRTDDVFKELEKLADRLVTRTGEKTSTALGNAVNALDKLQVKAEFGGYRKTAEAAEKFLVAQAESARMQNEVQSTAGDIAEGLASVYRNEKWGIPNAQNNLNSTKQRREEFAKLRANATKQIADLEARREKNQLEKNEKKRKSNQDVLDRDLKSKRDWLERVNKGDKNNDALMVKYENNLKKVLEHREELKTKYEDRANGKQIQNQDVAIVKQTALNGTIGILKKALDEDESKLEKLASEEFQDSDRVRQDATGMKMVQAFNLAKELEREIAESYKEIKATETAIQRKMSFKAAEKITDVAMPERIEANVADIELKPRTKDELDRQKQAQKEVVAEADDMVEASVAMMEETMTIVMPKDDAKTTKSDNRKEIRWLEEKDFETEKLEEKIAQMEQDAAFQIEMDKAAAEDNTKKAKDIAALMSNLREPDQAKPAVSGGGGRPPELWGCAKWLQPGNIAAVGGEPKDGKAIPAKWMYVNSWHVIGPFPNPNRINIRRKFAPESVVDLDATYVGDKGRQLRWTPLQARNRYHVNQPGGYDWNAAEVTPVNGEEYAIYYAYAEVFFDTDCDRWMAIGSDDRSDVWVNDFHVWGSSNKLKKWSLNEDYRRVHFKKGRNQILLRCENGHCAIGWSVCIALEDGIPKM